MIKFMNVAEGHKGNPIYINPDHISAVYPMVFHDGSLCTFIYGGLTGITWEVEEGLETVIKLINQSKNK